MILFARYGNIVAKLENYPRMLIVSVRIIRKILREAYLNFYNITCYFEKRDFFG